MIRDPSTYDTAVKVFDDYFLQRIISGTAV